MKSASKPNLFLSYPFDLRGLSPKQDTLRDTPLCQGWMIFLNKSRTLAHIMHQLDAADGSYVRMKVPVKLARDASTEAITNYFYIRMTGRYVL